MGRRGRGPLNVKLAITEILERADIAAAFDAFHVPVTGNPLGWAAIQTDPIREVLAIEEHRCVRWGCADVVRSAGYAGRYDRRLRPQTVVIEPIGVGL